MASDANDYPIYLLDHNGRLDAKLNITDGRAKALIHLVHIVREIFKTDHGKSAFVKLTDDFCESHPEAWFLQEKQGTREERIHSVVDDFLEMSMTGHGFSTLCLSNRLSHPNILGVTHRHEWKDHFELSSQSMLLNGKVSRKPTRVRSSLSKLTRQ